MTWTRRDFLKTASSLPLAAALARTTPAAAADRKPPNVLLILTDQQSAAMMSCTGNPWLKTPALDGLAERGTRFEKAYATNPVCVPSRFSLMTGHYASEVDVRHNGQHPSDRLNGFARRSLGHVFRAQGYETVYGGKVHLPGAMNKIKEQGFDFLTGNERNQLADAAENFLRKDREQPFLLVTSFVNPHDICYMAIRDFNPESGLAKHTPQPMLDAMKLPEGISREAFFAEHCPPLPDNFEPTDREPASVDFLLNERKFRRHVRDHWSEEQWRLHRWAYARLTERVDAQIGRVLDAVRDSGQEDNTLVVFTSDHGDMSASHRLEHKTFFYEESSRIPLIISRPGTLPTGRVDDQHLVSNGLDLLPTLCDLAGQRAPERLPGQSLRPLLEDARPRTWRDHVVMENQLGFMIHDGRYKYARYEQGENRDLLIDLQDDPGEMSNLAGRQDHRDTMRRLRSPLKRELKRRGLA